MEFDVDLLGVDGYITLSNVPVYLEIGSAVHVNGATDVAVGDNVEITIDAPHYKYGATADAFSIPAGFGSDTYSIPEGTNTIVQGFGGESDASLYEGIWGILNWYWVNEDDPFGSGETGRGALAAEDAQSTDTRSISRADIDAGNYYKAFEYGFEIAEEDIATLESYGLTVAPVMTNFSAANGSYEYESALSITGTPTQAGTVEFDVTFTCPLARLPERLLPERLRPGHPAVPAHHHDRHPEHRVNQTGSQDYAALPLRGRGGATCILPF